VSVSELSAAPETQPAAPLPWTTWSLCAVVLAIAIGIQLDGEQAAVRWGWRPALDVWSGKSWALVTSSLVHVELLHLVFNLYWLWVLGRSVERVLGPVRLAGLVLASALVSSAGQLAWGDETGIGFSGVGYALFGFAWVLSSHRRDLGIEVSRQTVRLFGIWLLFGMFATYAGLVNFGNAAHLIGGMFGICAGFTFIDRWRRAALTGIGALLMSAALVSVWAPWSPTWNAARAFSAYHRGDYRSAADWLDRSLRRGGNAAWIAETKAIVHWRAGERNEAQADIDALRRIDAKRAERFERKLHGEGK